MKPQTFAASLLTLALFALAPLHAVADDIQKAETAPIQLAQADVPAEVREFLKDRRDPSKLNEAELSDRIRTARRLARLPGLPEDVRSRIVTIAQDARTSLSTRSNDAGEQDQAAAEEAAPAEGNQRPRNRKQNSGGDQAAAEEQAAGEEQAETAPAPARAAQGETESFAQAAQLIKLQRPSKALDDDRLKARVAKVQRLLQDTTLTPRMVKELQKIAQSDRQEIQSRRAQAQAPAKQQQPVQQSNSSDQKGVLTAQRVNPPAKQAPAENAASEADKRARKLLADKRPAGSLNQRELKQRLASARDLLQGGELSPRVEKALRDFAASDRQVVRQRLAQAEDTTRPGNRPSRRPAEQSAEQSGETPPRRGSGGITEEDVANQTPPPRRPLQTAEDGSFQEDGVIDVSPQGGRRLDQRYERYLRDRRGADDLDDAELRERIQAYRDIESADDYARYRQDERDYWRRTMANDRDVLRRRLLSERQRRDSELAVEYRKGNLDIDLNLNVAPSRAPIDDIYVAEADDEQIEEILVAPPRSRIERRYTVDDIANEPELRRSIPRLEIDTIRFGFNESIVREEEIDKLDRIGSVIERILRKYPREVFLIEGHTDAVGSDAYNLNLSRARAEAVKRALSTYFNIPSTNMRTAGLGERFLKIPTQEEEAENRRVSLSRVTQYLETSQQ